MKKDKITFVSGFSVKNTMYTQCDYMLVAVTDTGKVLMSTGDGNWSDVGPKKPEQKCTCELFAQIPCEHCLSEKRKEEKEVCRCETPDICIINPTMGCRKCQKPLGD